ncbi:MAG: helix-turn-helix domain-containing protein [Bacteroidales bacterium]|nr:helix-turn-helix domain-containing protein [Bacteroidales bacterium]
MNKDTLYEQILSTRIEDWLDSQDVVHQLHISQRTLLKLRSDGTLPYSRINGKIYYRRQDIQKLLADNYTTTQNRSDYGNKE